MKTKQTNKQIKTKIQTKKSKTLHKKPNDKDFLETSKVYKCKECGEIINSTFKCMSDYVYKTKRLSTVNQKRIRHVYVDDATPSSYDYYCSYHCYCKGLDKRQEKMTREEKARKLNSYNGILDLREISLVEDICALADDMNRGKWDHSRPQDNIKSKEDFQLFLEKHKEELKLCIIDYGDLEEKDNLTQYLKGK